MELKDILSKCDHTLLAQTATWDEIKAICDDGMKYGCASVCIPASYVKQAAEYVAGKLPICTVIGFPNGYDTAAAKCFMAADAVNNGAEEVDMVINIGWVKDQKWEDLLSEIKAIKEACRGKLLKVIIECCFLTDEEKIKLCEIVTASGADYIKTSTGFGGGGKSLMGTLGTSQHVVQRQQFTDETGGADSHIIRFGADETGDRFRGGDGLGVTGLAGAGVGTAGVQNHGLDVTVGDDLTAPLHRGGTETVRGEHACSRVERAVVDHEGQVLLAFDG